MHPWESKFAAVYDALVERIGRANFRRVAVDDPGADWALGRASETGERTLGHEPLTD